MYEEVNAKLKTLIDWDWKQGSEAKLKKKYIIVSKCALDPKTKKFDLKVSILHEQYKKMTFSSEGECARHRLILTRQISKGAPYVTLRSGTGGYTFATVSEEDRDKSEALTEKEKRLAEEEERIKDLLKTRRSVSNRMEQVKPRGGQ